MSDQRSSEKRRDEELLEARRGILELRADLHGVQEERDVVRKSRSE